MTDIKERYESFNYEAIPFPQTHPVHLATISQLHGLEPVDPRCCRYLEVGCANGLNIIAMALAFPNSEFIGIDLAETAIAEGHAQIERLGLKNVRLIADDLLHYPLDSHPFDYVVAHGFYSWVPENVQRFLWQFCQQLLTPHGIAYISYNTYPGCYQRRMMREMMLFHTRTIEDPASKIQQAKAFLQFFDQALQVHGELVSTIREEVHQLLHLRQDYAIYHDDLAQINVPVYFHQFVATASEFGMQFLGEADYFESCFLHFPESVQANLRELEKKNVILKEQYLDFLKLRRFRETLLCRAEHRLERTVSRDRIKRQLFTSRARLHGEFRVSEEHETTFGHDKGAKLTLNHPLSKIALRLLGNTFPCHWSYENLISQSERLLQESGGPCPGEEDHAKMLDTLHTAYSVGLIELHCLAPAVALSPPGLPRVTSLVADQLKSGSRLVTNLMHIPVHIDTEFVAAFLGLCDGTRTREELIETCSHLAEQTDVPLTERVEHAIRQAIQLALFVE